MTTHIPYSRESKPEGWTKSRPPGYYERAAKAQRERRRQNPENVYIALAKQNKKDAWLNNKLSLPTGQYCKDLNK